MAHGESPGLVRELPTPAMTIDDAALQHNIDAFARWCEAHHVDHAPHGKTTMAPDIWHRQLAAGAWGITVSNFAQLDVALRARIDRIMIANQVVDESTAQLIASATGEVICWVDSVAGARRLDRALANTDARVAVLIEVGVPRGRCGVRDVEIAVEIAQYLTASDHLDLRGVAAFEGVIGGSRDSANLAAVDDLLSRVLEVHARCAPWYRPGGAIISLGGSTWFDAVVDRVGPLVQTQPDTRLILRSGGYVVHDHGYYRQYSPSSDGRGPALIPALRIWSRVLSMPEPGVAYLDAGKRDLPYDEGLPEVLAVWREGDPRSHEIRATLTRSFDQHSQLTGDVDDVEIGDVIELGISHPCTAFDKWRAIPLVAGGGRDARILGVVPTYF